MKRAVFLDRDGTLIEHVHHLSNPEDVVLIQGSAEAIRSLQAAGYACVVVTNQSIVGRGIIDDDQLNEIHDRMIHQLKHCGARLDAIYHCPFAPALTDDQKTIEHHDRKPGPGLLERAARDLQLDLSQSWMVGDSLSDLLAGRNAGCRGAILVRTGYGLSHLNETEVFDFVTDDINEAAKVILRESNAAMERSRPPGQLDSSEPQQKGSISEV